MVMIFGSDMLGASVNYDWIQGIIGTGLLYGAVVTYSGSMVYVSSGSGIIVNVNASTAAEIDPTITPVRWNNVSASISGINTRQTTYIYIDATGSLQQQATPFTSDQYRQTIALGAVGHFNYSNISAFGGEVTTAYSQTDQYNTFVDSFGPLKLDGYSLAPISGALSLSVGSGTAFSHGGFYEYSPNSPSVYNSSTVATASIIRVYRSGSGVYFDTNNNSGYTTLDPTKYDNGSGVLQNVPSNDYTIQRVFSFPPTNTLYVYYGQTTYANLATALQSIASDNFIEGKATATFTVFVGYVITRENSTDFTNTLSTRILNSGLFRNSIGGGAGGTVISNKIK